MRKSETTFLILILLSMVIGLNKIMVKADSYPLENLCVSLPAGTPIGPNPDPWLDKGWNLTIYGHTGSFVVRVNLTSHGTLTPGSWSTRLIIALNEEAYNNLVDIVVDPLGPQRTLHKTDFQYGTPKPGNVWTWSDDVYPTWFNDAIIVGSLFNILGCNYRDVTVSATFSNATGAKMHFDAYGSTSNCGLTSLEQLVINPNHCDSTIVFAPLKLCNVTFLTDPVCSNFNITFLCSTYHQGNIATFPYNTTGQATANCPSDWVFDHWEVTGNIQISNTTTNPTNITINCGGTLKAVFRLPQCQVTFYTEPACNYYYINFQCKNYHNGTTDTFAFGTSGLATANCPDGWVFDHWEATGNVQVSNVTENPTNVTICCGGTLKAIFKCQQCQVTFLTDPVCSCFNITFQCKTYHNGTKDIFPYGTSADALANCPSGWVFDHWEVIGNISVSNSTQNPTCINIKCGGTLKAVFKPVACQVTFLTDPVCNNYYITFQCKNYHNGTTDTFAFGTSGLATANCPDGWEFDHWEVTGNIQISNTTTNPTNITICCGGTLKAVFRVAGCQVTFLTDPVCTDFNINFQCKTYYNGTTDTFNYGTSGLATANCPEGWKFDRWEVTGNIQVSNTTRNPTDVAICCGGTLKAIFKQALCAVTFLTDPVCSGYCITFRGSTYHQGDVATFPYGTSGEAIANCPSDWVFDHWETTGNVTVSNITANPTCVTIKCGGTIKAIFKDPPCASFTSTQHSPEVTFDASSSYDSDGYIVSYIWDFGDGNLITLYDPIVTHHYIAAGTYEVTLTVVDNDGLKHSVKQTLTIKLLEGDLNNDGKIDIMDVAIVARAFGSKPGEPKWNEQADLDKSGKVDIRDVTKVAREYGKTY